MQQYSQVEHFLVDVKKNAVIVYTADQDVDELLDALDLFPGARSAKARAVLERALTFSPMLQFVLVNAEERLFEPQRYSFLGAIDDWINIGEVDALPTLLRSYVRHLGEDSFYDLY